MKKIGIRIGLVAIILLLIYGIGVIYFSNNLIYNTSLYGKKVNSYNETTLKDLIAKKDISLKVKDKRDKIDLPLSVLNFKVTNAATIQKEMISKQNVYSWPLKMITGQNFESAQIEVSNSDLKTWIKENKIVSNKGLPQSKDAYFNVSTGKAEVVPEVVGEQLDDSLVSTEIRNSLKKGSLHVDLNKAIIKPNVVASVLNKTVSEVDFKLKNLIKLTISNKNQVIEPSFEDKLKWLNIDYEQNKITIEKKAIRNYLKAINKDNIKKGGSTETVYRVGKGSSTLVTKGKAVSGVDEIALMAKIYDAMQNNNTLEEEVKAVTISTPKIVYEGHDSIDNNFVEVSISQQKVYLYTNGKLVLTSDVVTGKPNGDTDTPKGKFSVMYKTTNFVLKGAAYGYDYKLPVAYWIPFEGGGGVGLHDAPWRASSSFGGNLYLSSGSHGCINMRKADVSKIYNTISAGTGVWVH